MGRKRRTITIMGSEIPVVDKLPKGWKLVYGGTTAPKGYVWCYNGKSRFGGEYEHLLVRVERRDFKGASEFGEGIDEATALERHNG